MIYRIIAFVLMILAYLFVFIGRILKRKMYAKKITIVKNKRTLFLKSMVAISTILLMLVQVADISYGAAILGYTGRGILLKVFGSYFGIIANLILFAATFEKLKYCIKKKKTGIAVNIISTGIYNYCRFPDVFGMMFLNVSVLMMYFNYYVLVVTVINLIILYIYIINKEKKYEEEFGSEYVLYKKRVHRFFGEGNWDWRKIRITVYAIFALFSCFYFFTCVAYAGIRLSAIWLWPLLFLFCVIRILMLKFLRPVRTWEKKIFKFISVIYHIVMIVSITIFLVTEFHIIKAMNTVPDDGLNYILVLGAGLNGEKPTRPLQLRIERAYRYLISSPDTIAIASGGQGDDEVISEAEAIKNGLVELGIEPSRILLEDRSTSTEENIIYSYEIINKDIANRKAAEGKDSSNITVGIVSNSFHIYRASLIAKYQGHDVVDVPAQTLFPVGIHYVVREVIGVLLLHLVNIV